MIANGLVLLVGWKAISAACGGASPNTLRRWNKAHPMPIVRHGRQGVPTISVQALELWQQRRLEAQKAGR